MICCLVNYVLPFRFDLIFKALLTPPGVEWSWPGRRENPTLSISEYIDYTEPGEDDYS